MVWAAPDNYPARLLYLSMNLNVYIDHWIIEDGNYADFSNGERRQFALEFWAPNPLSRVQTQEKSITASTPYMYQVNARVAFSSASIVVIDFGLLAYSQTSDELQRGLKAGDLVNGDIRLCVDPFFYFEELSTIHGLPPLIYEWRVDSIQLDTTPLILGEVRGGTAYVRDESRTSFVQVESTEEITPNVDKGALTYVLQCTKLETAPMKQFSRPQV